MFYLQLFGSPDLTGPDGQGSLSVLSQQKRLALLAYLAMAEPRGYHSRDKLLALLWPESDLEHGRNSLRQSVHFLRRRLGPDALVNRGEGEIAVSREALACDVVRFVDAIEGNEPEKALALYKADLLQGFFIPDAPPFEEWLDGERARLRRKGVAAAWSLCEKAAADGEHELGLTWALRALELDPSDEGSARRVILAQGRLGNSAAATQVYRELESRLERDYELKPSPETTAALEAVRTRVVSTEVDVPVALLAPAREAEARLLPPIPPREARPAPPIAQRVAPRVRVGSYIVRRFARRSFFGRSGAVRLQISVGLVLSGVLASWASGLIPLATRPLPASTAKALAVLPFRAIGPEGDRSFVAEAMHQEILTQLARVQTLRVIALGSVVDFQIDMEDNRAVAEKLGVEYLIRGALQSTGDRIRIWARLVEARTDQQLWASSFEGDRDDMFEIQMSVATEIAEALEARFPVDPARAVSGPTENPAAYEAYLRGRLHSARVVNRADALQAAAHLEEAVRLDPGFAPAWAALSYTKLLLAYAFAEHDELEGAEAALERAETLAPDDVETWLAEAYFHSYASQDYGRALVRLRQILALQPSHAAAMALQGFVQRREGLWEQAAASMTAALELDPNSYSTTVVLAEMYMRMRRYDAAERLLDRAIAMSPEGELAYVQKALLHINARGDAEGAAALLAKAPLSPKNHGLPALVALFGGDSGAALELLLRHPGSETEVRSAEEMISLGLIYRLRGDQESAMAWADSIQRYLGRGPRPEELASTAGGVWPLANAHSFAAVAFALSGRGTEAVASAERAVGWLPLSRDAYAGAELLERLAEVYALTGRTEAAVATLDQLLAVPSRITPWVIRRHPAYVGLQDDPAFARLLANYPVDAASTAASLRAAARH